MITAPARQYLGRWHVIVMLHGFYCVSSNLLIIHPELYCGFFWLNLHHVRSHQRRPRFTGARQNARVILSVA